MRSLVGPAELEPFGSKVQNARGAMSNASLAEWWRNFEQVDPISLEPMSTLPYPPFELRASGPSGGADSAGDWFDGRVLALYLVSRGHFSHPISRRALERAECVALDKHLDFNRLHGGISEVARVFDHAASAGGDATSILLEERRAHERALTEALYRDAARGASAATATTASPAPAPVMGAVS